LDLFLLLCFFFFEASDDFVLDGVVLLAFLAAAAAFVFGFFRNAFLFENVCVEKIPQNGES
jgi:hypothetical protein